MAYFPDKSSFAERTQGNLRFFLPPLKQKNLTFPRGFAQRHHPPEITRGATSPEADGKEEGWELPAGLGRVARAHRGFSPSQRPQHRPPRGTQPPSSRGEHAGPLSTCEPGFDPPSFSWGALFARCSATGRGCARSDPAEQENGLGRRYPRTTPAQPQLHPLLTTAPGALPVAPHTFLTTRKGKRLRCSSEHPAQPLPERT